MELNAEQIAVIMAPRPCDDCKHLMRCSAAPIACRAFSDFVNSQAWNPGDPATNRKPDPLPWRSDDRRAPTYQKYARIYPTFDRPCFKRKRRVR